MRRVRILLLWTGCAALAGCGYVGEPLPPALKLPGRIVDLAAVQRGSKIIVQYTLPKLTTEGQAIQTPPEIQLRINGESRPIPSGVTRHEFPAEPFYNQTVSLAIFLLNENHRDAGPSNTVALKVVPSLPTPNDLRAVSDPAGVKLTWQPSSGTFRVLRKSAGEKQYTVVATPSAPSFIDTGAEFGKTYHYIVQTVVALAESDLSAEETIAPKDTFAPAVPSGLTAVVSTQSIELVWDRNVEPDLGGYRIYRAAGDGPFARITETQESPSYSDRKPQSGAAFRYRVSSIDRAGNESEPSPSVSAVSP